VRNVVIAMREVVAQGSWLTVQWNLSASTAMRR
jgi:hypothetical protein